MRKQELDFERVKYMDRAIKSEAKLERIEKSAREVLRIVEGNGGLKEGQQLPVKVEYHSGLQRIAPLLRKVLRNPDCKGRDTHMLDEVCDCCRNCGGGESDPDGLCELCLKCSLCCENCGTFDDEQQRFC